MAGLRFRKKDFLIAFLLSLAFFLTRLINLTIIPIFTDEAIYLRWAQIAKNDAAWRFISLTDGKQPLFVWLTMVMMKFVGDPLVAGRFVSVLAGLANMIAIWVLSYLLFKNKRISYFASLLYLFSPFALVYDRMALMDALVGTFSLLSLIGLILLVKTKRLDVALILGWILGGGILTKTSGFLNIYLSPLSLFLFNWRDKKRWLGLFKFLALLFLSIIISQVFYSVLRLSPWFHMVAQKDTTFIYPIKEWLGHPFRFLEGNLKGEIGWLTDYLTWPVTILAILSLLSIWRKAQEKLLLFSWFSAPFVGLALFGKVLYPRFIFFMSLSLLVLTAWSLEKIAVLIKRRWLFFLFCFLFFIPSLSLDYQLLFHPQKASLPRNDKEQYISGWPAGYGVREVVSFAKKKAEKGKIFIATEGTFGLMPASLELYLWDNPDVEIKGFWPIEKMPKEVLERAKQEPTYFVLNETQKTPQNWPLKLIARYSKGNSESSMSLYQVVSDESH